MAKIIYTALGGALTVECDAATPKDVFKKVAVLQEMMSDKCCGCCKSPNIAFVVRTAQNREGKDVEYYELKCQEAQCGAALSFGQHQSGATLFAKRWDKDARAPLPNNGWHIYVRTDGGGGYQQGGGGYQQPQQGGYQHGGPPQQGRQPQQGGWGQPPQQQLGPPPPQDEIPF